MHKFYRIKRDILACLMACMFIGGMGVDTYAAEVVDTQIPEETALPAGDLYGQIKTQIKISQNVQCTVEKNGTVTYTAELNNSMPASDDGILYLLEMAPYEYDVSNNMNIVSSKAFERSETETKIYLSCKF